MHGKIRTDDDTWGCPSESRAPRSGVWYRHPYNPPGHPRGLGVLARANFLVLPPRCMRVRGHGDTRVGRSLYARLVWNFGTLYLVVCSKRKPRAMGAGHARAYCASHLQYPTLQQRLAGVSTTSFVRSWSPTNALLVITHPCEIQSLTLVQLSTPAVMFEIPKRRRLRFHRREGRNTQPRWCGPSRQ